MPIINIHQRDYPVPPEALGPMLDSLSSHNDRLWPVDMWPRMRLDRPLEVGASGGHGPIGYTVEAHEPGRSVRFRFTRPRGFDGIHRLEILPAGSGRSRLRHTIEMETRGLAHIAWPLAIRPLHDALLEDALARAEASLGLAPQVTPWSVWVKVLRWSMSRGRAVPQRVPTPTKPAATVGPAAAPR